MTTLPIEYRRRPWKARYIDEETPVCNRWFIFGEYPDGTVTITDGTADILEYVPRAEAERIVEARNAFVDVLLGVIGYRPGD